MPFPPGFTDLQSWTRDVGIEPDWLRVGTDIVGGTAPPKTQRRTGSERSTTERSSPLTLGDSVTRSNGRSFRHTHLAEIDATHRLLAHAAIAAFSRDCSWLVARREARWIVIDAAIFIFGAKYACYPSVSPRGCDARASRASVRQAALATPRRLLEHILHRARRNSKFCKSGHPRRRHVIDLHQLYLIAGDGRFGRRS